MSGDPDELARSRSMHWLYDAMGSGRCQLPIVNARIFPTRT